MLVYAIKRILLMVPTLFAVSLLIFILLNISAGDPGAQQAAGDGNQDAQKSDNRESYRIFKEQFNLDKPIYSIPATALVRISSKPSRTF